MKPTNDFPQWEMDLVMARLGKVLDLAISSPRDTGPVGVTFTAELRRQSQQAGEYPHLPHTARMMIRKQWEVFDWWLGILENDAKPKPAQPSTGIDPDAVDTSK